MKKGEFFQEPQLNVSPLYPTNLLQQRKTVSHWGRQAAFKSQLAQHPLEGWQLLLAGQTNSFQAGRAEGRKSESLSM